MKVETFYHFGTQYKPEKPGEVTIEIFDKRLKEVPAMITQKFPDFVINANGLDLTSFKLGRQAYEGYIRCENGMIAEIIVQDCTTILNISLSLDSANEALLFYRRIRDKSGHEWELIEGDYPSSPLEKITGEVHTKSRITSWAAAMGQTPPHISFVEELRKWKLVDQISRLPRK